MLVAGPTRLEVEIPRSELEFYLRVWAVLYPDAEVQLGGNGDDEAPAALGRSAPTYDSA